MNTLPMTLDAQLDKLETAQLVRRSEDQDLAYSFKHTLTQETAYNLFSKNADGKFTGS